ncbi:uncharacterized protein LOC130773468 isoform X1 [Actinidia eriantha]|uniref:uncharacterized protein LOC130773468 isoform X1 n=2 Tax=Actinidia eriantha TaxID=165200 RepID=UPI002587B522|nr:uncharacterized protein LOC130773468 isoform X1 [Actinidia eriantha]XP_057487394.1 uncharacterized protein LOC130773468 isoform X1 [Actinidia eriantha]
MVRTPKSSKIGQNILERNMNQYYCFKCSRSVLCCAAEFQEMTEDCGEENLIDKTETYLNEMLVSTAESLSGIFSKEKSGNVKQMHCSRSQESDRSLDETVPDGDIIAVQDVHQHMYTTVEGLESKYSLVGTIHYSLVGDRALFRIIFAEGWQGDDDMCAILRRLIFWIFFSDHVLNLRSFWFFNNVTTTLSFDDV